TYWRSVFAPLARRLDAYVVAGSHLRLAPDGDLTNASYLFAPDGRLVATTDKVNLVAGREDMAPGALGLARGDLDRLPIVETPFGRVCTLICYDGFRVPHTKSERFVPVAPRIAARGAVAIAANPSASHWRWREPWLHDVSMTREVQWSREGLPASLAEIAFARIGITAHLVGQVLDLTFEGQSEILERTPTGVTTLARAPTADRGGHVVAVIESQN
nr:carbon-nitrogen hydrolase family protein [Deltaproteobacteria bacterium]